MPTKAELEAENERLRARRRQDIIATVIGTLLAVFSLVGIWSVCSTLVSGKNAGSVGHATIDTTKTTVFLTAPTQGPTAAAMTAVVGSGEQENRRIGMSVCFLLQEYPLPERTPSTMNSLSDSAYLPCVTWV